ncbi:metallophosphoesterase [Paracrocinitomix mangrovi]|uniref:metallophosphoesterase n=1 Tax=Paracrocinitomix mangrovi TaxID=2862509 RepID=UPI001C8F15E4|nr:metallophosphoesterase [Paracrocinitomix mangrovi]UKN00968.1 metallophosphoesterase [Paracrocinitomix mangrovi]
MRFIVLLITFLAIGSLLEWYTYSALSSRWDHWSPWLKHTTKITFFVLLGLGFISLIMLFVFGPYFSRAVLNFWFSFLLINFFTKFFFAFILLIDDIRRLSIFTQRKISGVPIENGISRSDFLVKTGLSLASVPLVGLSYGMLAGPYRYKVRNQKVKLDKLPKAFDGLKIVQISDIHSGSFYNSEAVERGVDLIMAQNADVIFFTGDIVNDRAEEMEPYMEIFSRLNAPLGVYSILGNHDYGDYVRWESDEAKENNNKKIRELHGELGWRLLLNEHLYLEKEGDKIGLIGVENWGKGFHQVGDLAKAYEGCEADVKLLLSHDPTHFDEVVKKEYPDIDIMFAGHTHGAQIGIETGGFKWSPIQLRYKKWAGLYEENGQYLYVNRGFGFLGYAGRLGIMPEITVMELTT